MIDKGDVIAFFDRCAPSWDAEMKRDDAVINTILDNAGVRAGARVLDIACGTGVLIPDYISRGVKCVVGVDISPEMIKIASSKFKDKDVSFVCADAETSFFGKLRQRQTASLNLGLSDPKFYLHKEVCSG